MFAKPGDLTVQASMNGAQCIVGYSVCINIAPYVAVPGVAQSLSNETFIGVTS